MACNSIRYLALCLLTHSLRFSRKRGFGSSFVGTKAREPQERPSSLFCSVVPRRRRSRFGFFLPQSGRVWQLRISRTSRGRWCVANWKETPGNQPRLRLGGPPRASWPAVNFFTWSQYGGRWRRLVALLRVNEKCSTHVLYGRRRVEFSRVITGALETERAPRWKR